MNPIESKISDYVNGEPAREPIQGQQADHPIPGDIYLLKSDVGNPFSPQYVKVLDVQQGWVKYEIASKQGTIAEMFRGESWAIHARTVAQFLELYTFICPRVLNLFETTVSDSVRGMARSLNREEP